MAKTYPKKLGDVSHEALMMTESPDVKEATVAEVFQNGYILHGRVIRHAKVKVSMPAKNN